MNPFKGIGIVALCLLFLVGIGMARSLAPGASAAQKAASVASEKDAGDRSDTPPYAFHLLRNGKIDATIENRGIFGNAYLSGNLEDLCVAEVCQSFETPAGSGLEYLFAGSVWIGGIVGDDTLVTVAADGWWNVQETTPAVKGDTFAGPSDHAVWTLFTDTAAVQTPYDPNVYAPLNLRVANRAYLWDGSPEDNAIIYDMVITNMGDQTLEQGYVGFHFDADVYHAVNQSTGFADDLTGSLPQSGIAYIIDNDGDPGPGGFDATSPTKAFAFKFLQTSFLAPDTSYNWWIPNTTPAYDYGPMPVDEYGNPVCDFGGHTGYPEGDDAKYCLLSHPGWDYDQIFAADTIPGWMPPPAFAYANDLVNGYDTRFLMSIGPFTLMPDSSVRILFTTFTGDSVLRVTDNMANLPDDPEQYLANLDFSHLTANAVTADAMGGTLLDPALAVTGLYTRHNDADSVVVEWDPWGFGDVEGYDIFLYEVQADDLSYPGVVPPWLKPPALPPVTTVGRTYHHAFTGLNKYHSYLVNVANRYGGTTGDIGQPLIVQAGGMAPAPVPESDYIFIPEGKGYPITLNWTAPPDVEVDHYNIYRFTSPMLADQKYYPRYDTGEFQDSVAAKDSFLVEGVRYYYYAMTPYAQADSWQTSFSELANDSTVYMITAVDPTGLESAFSIDVTVLVVPEMTKDILVLTCSGRFSANYVYPDTLAAFYQRILQGYDFDIYRWRDTILAYPDIGLNLKAGWWYDLMRYRLVIVDDGFIMDAIYDTAGVHYGETVSGLAKFLLYGGKMAYCGSLETLHGFTSTNASPAFYAVDHPFVQRFFGVDSVFRIGIAYYLNPTNPTVQDYLMGMIEAVSAGSPVPNVGYDTLQNPFFWASGSTFWPPNTVASPSVFVLNDKGQTIQTLRSRFPETSLVDGLPVGIRTETDEATTYLYGYHLWLMNDLDARALVDYMMGDTTAFSIAATIVEPDTMLAMFANAIDVRPGRVYVAYEDSQYTVADVDPSSILINGVIGPLGTEIVTDPEIPGGEALAADIDLRPFVAEYLPAWDTTVQTYTVTGALTDGTPLALQGNFILVGHISGDANGDQAVTIGDAVFVVNYVFRDGPAPLLAAAADANADGRVDLGDAVCLVNFIFRGGVRPQHP